MKKMTRVQRKMRRRRRFFRIVLLIIIFTIIFKLARESDYFKIKSIGIKGNKLIQKERIEEKSNIKPGMNIFDVSVLRAKKNIKQIVYIKDLKVRRKLPNQINIVVEERKEAVQFKLENKYVIIDDEGIILDIRDKQVENIVMIVGVEFKKPLTKKELGNKIAGSIKEDANEEFLYYCVNTNLLNRLKKIQISKDKNIDLITKENKLVEFGNVYNSQYKLELLKEIFTHIDKEEIEYSKIIMDKGDNPVIVTEKAGG